MFVFHIGISLCAGLAEWMFIIGLYGVTREVMTTTFSWLSVLSELAMPFYLTHQQILVMVVAGASWYPHLSESLMKCQLSTSPLPLAIFAGSFPVVLSVHRTGRHMTFNP